MAEGSLAAIELEALSYTFPSGELQVHQSEPLCLEVHASPYTGERSSQQFVQATLYLHTSKDYPDEPAMVSIQAVKGMQR